MTQVKLEPDCLTETAKVRKKRKKKIESWRITDISDIKDESTVDAIKSALIAEHTAKTVKPKRGKTRSRKKEKGNWAKKQVTQAQSQEFEPSQTVPTIDSPMPDLIPSRATSGRKKVE